MLGCVSGMRASVGETLGLEALTIDELVFDGHSDFSIPKQWPSGRRVDFRELDRMIVQNLLRRS